MPKIDIIIKNGGTPEGARPEAVAEQERVVQEQGKPSLQTKAINTALIGLSKQAFTVGLNQYGNLTGNYATVETIDNTLGFIADAGMIAAGGAVGAIAVGAKYAIQGVNSYVEQFNKNQELAEMMKRSGNVALKGSRYSYD